MDATPATITSQARVATDVPRRYLAQLCKHFQHKVPVELGETTGRIAFPMGTCTLAAEAAPPALLMHATAPDEASLAKLEDVVARHLERFAFRDPLSVTWRRS